jgi:hypothetical protein
MAAKQRRAGSDLSEAIRQQAILLSRRRRQQPFGRGPTRGGSRVYTGGSRWFNEATGRYRNFGIAPRRLARLLPEGSEYADKPGAIRRAYARRERREERREEEPRGVEFGAGPPPRRGAPGTIRLDPRERYGFGPMPPKRRRFTNLGPPPRGGTPIRTSTLPNRAPARTRRAM